MAVFAGAFTFGTILALPNSLEKFDLISDLLSVAFLLFATCLFFAIGIHHLLRRYDPTEPLLPRTRLLCKIHTTILTVLLVAGFTLLYLVLFNIGKKIVSIVGIVLLYLMPVWRLAIEYAERTGKLPVATGHEVVTERVQDELRPKV